MVPLVPSHRHTAIRILASATIALALAARSTSAAAQQATGASANPAATPADEARIRDIITTQVTAWNAGDAKTFSASFAENGSFTNIRGTVFYGHHAFEDRHVEIFRTFFKGTRLAMSPTKIRFVRPDVAIVDIATEVTGLRGGPPGVKARADGSIHTRLQEVFVKNDGEWVVESYHNVDVKGR
ncbi:MAG TPA: SgcJ/EcaC family oxidoreductase [Chloroflexia bacterium]|nr:SgcJ/EcaC family oxidoreductase [Chloroflexia bacterium]